MTVFKWKNRSREIWDSKFAGVCACVSCVLAPWDVVEDSSRDSLRRQKELPVGKAVGWAAGASLRRFTCGAQLCGPTVELTSRCALRSDSHSESEHEARKRADRKASAPRAPQRRARSPAHSLAEALLARGHLTPPRANNISARAGRRSPAAPLWSRASQESRVGARSAQAKERFFQWRVQRSLQKSTRSVPSIPRSAGDPEAQRRGATVKRPGSVALLLPRGGDNGLCVAKPHPKGQHPVAPASTKFIPDSSGSSPG